MSLHMAIYLVEEPEECKNCGYQGFVQARHGQGCYNQGANVIHWANYECPECAHIMRVGHVNDWKKKGVNRLL